MDANELVNVAYDAMSGIDLTAHDRGQIYGVLQMALRSLEAQHESLLAEADEETTEAKKLWREALAELESAKAEVAAAKPYPVLEQTLLDMNRAQRERDAFAAELDAIGKRLANAQREIERLTLERDGWKSEAGELGKRIDALNAENARIHRSLEERMTAHIPGAVQVAKTEELHGMAKVHLVPPGTDEL